MTLTGPSLYLTTEICHRRERLKLVGCLPPLCYLILPVLIKQPHEAERKQTFPAKLKVETYTAIRSA